MNKLRPLIKCNGGKFYLSEWIIDNFPEGYEEMTYCEPFCGGGSVLFNKLKSKCEAINDVDKGLISIFKAVRDEPKELVARLRKLKYTERAFNRALKKADGCFEDYLDQAVNEYVLRRMSRGGQKKAFACAGKAKSQKAKDQNTWAATLKQLSKISARLQGVHIFSTDFRQIIKYWDEEGVFMYLDPTHLPSAKKEKPEEGYCLNMDDHLALLGLIKNARAKIMISGIYSSLYSKTLDKTSWHYHKKEVVSRSDQSGTKARRIEYIWTNY